MFMRRVISIIAAVNFLFTNCLWADTLAVQSRIVSILRDAKVIYAGTALHSALVTSGVDRMRALYKTKDDIRKRLKESLGDKVDVDSLKTLIFEGDGGVVYYTFSPDGYFYRFAGDGVKDDPLNRLIEGYMTNRGPREKVVIGDTRYYMDIIQTSPEIVPLLNASINELYPEVPWDIDIPADIAVEAVSATAAYLTMSGLRGGAFKLNEEREKGIINILREEADRIGRKVFEYIVKKLGKTARIHVSEGFNIDERRNIFNPKEVINLQKDAAVEDVNIDLIEGTRELISNLRGKKLSELPNVESGATSVLVYGEGVKSLGDCPDIYANGVFTRVPKDKQQDFMDNPLDPDEKPVELLRRIAKANGITIDKLEVVIPDREREDERIGMLKALQNEFPGLVITKVESTIVHTLLATFGRKDGRHRVVMGVAGAEEVFLNLAITGLFRDEGAVASVRLCSRNVNRTDKGIVAVNLNRRYPFSAKEKSYLKDFRPQDYNDIIDGKKLFTQKDVNGDVAGAVAFITDNAVFGVEGVEKMENGDYKVRILRFSNIGGRPSLWWEDKVVKDNELASLRNRIYRSKKIKSINFVRNQGILHALYTRMKRNGIAYTVGKAAGEHNIPEKRAKALLEWLSSIDRELQSKGDFRGIEKVSRNGITIYKYLNPDDINPDIFRDYDYRSPDKGGIDFSPKRVFFMTLMWVKMALERRDEIRRGNNNVVIAKDCRKSPREVIEAMIKAVEYSGLQPIYVGETPNCSASYAWAVRRHSPLMGIFLTASHVKADDVMGAKVSILGESGELESLSEDKIQEVSQQDLVRILRDPDYLGLIKRKPTKSIPDNVESTYGMMARVVGLVVAGRFKGNATKRNLYELAVDLENAKDILKEIERYLSSIVDTDAKPLAGLKVVIEAAHTPSGRLAEGVYKALGAEVILIHGEIKELSGQHKADPSIIENLKELMDTMEKKNAHLGLAFDLDGDRGAIVVPTKEKDPQTERNFAVLPPDNLMQALLPFFDRQGYSVKEGNKVAVVRDVLSTKGVDEKAESLGYIFKQTDTGYVFLKERVRELKRDRYTVPVYAERSGHAWTHVTGAFEDPIVVSILFAIMGGDLARPFIEVFQENSLPYKYKQSTRFQPLFNESFYEKLSKDTETGGEPTKVIALGRHRVIERIKEDFSVGNGFDTSAGRLVVSGLDVKVHKDKNRYADIRFTLNGKDAGSFVFRASANDPTWVCSFETPLRDGEDFSSESVQLRYDSVGGLVLHWLEKNKFARVAGEGFDYQNKKDAEGTLQRYRDKISGQKTQGSHIVMRQQTGEERLVRSLTIDEAREEIPALKRLEEIYGLGISTQVDEIQVVENLGGSGVYPEGRAPLASYRDGILKIDEIAFRYGPELVSEELEHELLESIAGLIPGITHAFADIISTVRNVRRFLESGSDEQEKLLSVLRGKNPIDPDGEYLRLLERLLGIKEVSKEEVISSVVRYVFRTKLYEKVRDELGLPEEAAGRIRELEPRLDDALQIFNEIAKAKEGLVDEISKTGDIAIDIIKTFSGLRVKGLERLGKRLSRMVAGTVKQVSSMDRITGKLIKGDRVRYILVDTRRIGELKGAMGEEKYRYIEGQLRGNNYEIVTELPAGVGIGDVIRLVDPGDLEDVPKAEGMLYLPMPYTRSSLIMAAVVLGAGGEVGKVDSLVKGFIGDLYSQILGREVTDSDLEILFREPWRFLPEIRAVLEDLDNLRKAVSLIEKAA